MKGRGRLSLLVALLALAGIGLGLRYQGKLEETLFIRRLAQDLPPDDAVKAARALRQIDGTAFERLGPESKLRYYLANGVAPAATQVDVAEAPGPQGGDPAAALRLARELQRREGETIALIAALTATHEDLVVRYLRDASDPTVRRTAAQCLARGGDRKALDALRARLGDPDEKVRLAVLQAGGLIAARLHDEAGAVQFLVDASRVPSLVRPVLASAQDVQDPRVIPVLIAYLSLPDVEQKERDLAADLIRKRAGPERAASAPIGTSGDEWRAWWERVSK